MWDIGRRHERVVRGSAARGTIAASEAARRDGSCFPCCHPYSVSVGLKRDKGLCEFYS